MTEEYPLPENPIPSNMIDPVEESRVAESEHFAEIRERNMQGTVGAVGGSWGDSTLKHQ